MTLLTIPFLLLLGLVLPLMGLISFRLSKGAPASQASSAGMRAFAIQIVVLQTVVGSLALLAAYGAKLELAWFSEVSLQTASVSLAVLFGFIAVARFEARKRLGRSETIRAELRKVPAIDPAWVSVMVFAGFVEEFAYRGVLTALMSSHIDYWHAAVASAGLFGLSHFTIGVRGAAAAFLFALAMQSLVFLSGGLLLAVAIHAAYDLVAARLGNRIEKQQIELTDDKD